MTALRALLARLARWRDRHLRLVVAALVGLTALGVLQVVRPVMPTTQVLVAARAVPAGTALTEQDLRVSAVPIEAAVSGSLTEPAQALGHRSGTALAPGQPITAAMLAPARDLPAGQVALPVPVTATEAAWLHAGDTVLLALNTGPSNVRTENVTSISSPPPQFTASVLAISSPTGGNTAFTPTAGVSVLLRIRSQNVNEIAAAARAGSLSVSLSS